MNPEQAWQSALGQLQMEMPKASFDTWVRDTRVVAFEDGLFTIGVRNAYACEWLQGRLTSTVTHLLQGIMNQPVEVRFVVETIEAEEDVDEGDILPVEAVHDTQYSEEVVPNSVVVIDAYVFRLLEQGDIDHNQASLYLGFHQAAWRLWKAQKGETQNLSCREVGAWAMMSRACFFKEIAGIPVVNGDTFASLGEGSGQAMIGLVEKVAINKKRHYREGRQIRTIANRYRVHMSPRLTRADASAIEKMLQSCLNGSDPTDYTPLLAALEGLNKRSDIADLFPEKRNAPLDQPDGPVPTTVMGIIRKIASIDGELPVPLRESAEKLHSRIINHFGKILFTQYFLRTVVPALQLTRPQAWLIAWLRDHCFQDENTKRDYVAIDGGITALARKVGVSADSIWDWLAEDKNGNPVTPVSCFAAVMEFKEFPADFRSRNTVFLKVRLEEPLVVKLLEENDGRPLRSQHGGRRAPRKCAGCGRDVYDIHEAFILSKAARKAIKVTRSSIVCISCAEEKLGRKLSSLDFEDVSSDRSELLAERAGDFQSSGNMPGQPRLETPENRDLRPLPPRLETQEPELETPIYRDLRLEKPKLETPFNLFKPLNNSIKSSFNPTSEEMPGVVVPENWDITRLMNINPTDTSMKIALSGADPNALASWLLYAVSPAGRGIENPWSFAISKLKRSPNAGAGGAYDRLAALPPKELVRLLHSSSENWRAADFYQSSGIGNKLWEETIGVKNSRVGQLLDMLLGERN